MRIYCSADDASVPCRCDPVAGCGHLSSWHRVTERWIAACMVPGCECARMDVCDCCEGFAPRKPDDTAILSALGIGRLT